jgi:hypothetical protein
MNITSRKIFFFHNPKAGGSSIRGALKRAVPQASESPIIENTMVEHFTLASHASYKKFCGYDHYFGHYGKDIFNAVDDGHLAITNFRHPASRIASLYNYFRHSVTVGLEQSEEEKFYAVRFAKNNDFYAFVMCHDPRVSVYTRNQHVRQLTRSPWDTSPGNFQQAKEFVAVMPWYYVCEYPDLSLSWMYETLGISSIDYENETIKNNETIRFAELEVDLIKKICSYNADDLALYYFAVTSLLTKY